MAATGAESDLERWVDISVPLQTGMVHWPGDPEPILERIAEIERGDEVNVTFLRMTAHSGTHMDAPCHLIQGGAGIETFPLDAGVGPARVIPVSEDCASVGPAELSGRGIKRGDRILLKTRNAAARWDNQEFQRGFVALNLSGAQFLVDAGVKLVGIDYLSIGLFDGDGPKTHRILMAANVWILEGLDLREVSEGEYDLICLPLKIEGSDGAPARAIVRPRSKTSSK